MQDVLDLLIEKFKEKYSKNFHIPKFLVLRNCMKCIYTKFTSSTYLFHSQNSYSLNKKKESKRYKIFAHQNLYFHSQNPKKKGKKSRTILVQNSLPIYIPLLKKFPSRERIRSTARIKNNNKKERKRYKPG